MRHVTARLAPLALLPALALAAATLPAHAGDGPLTLTVGTGSIQQFVPDLDSVTRKLVVKKAGRITDLNVVVAAEHTAISDFSFLLRSPQGRVVHLSSNNGGNADGYGSPSVDGCGSTMRFDDEAAEHVADFDGVDHIFEGGYQPESRIENSPKSGLASLDGRGMKGTWELIVTDTDEFGGGVLECVKLQFTYTALG